MAAGLRTLSLGLLLAVFVQLLSGLRYLTLPPWMSVNSAKDAAPILKRNGTRPVDCIILALEENLKPSFFYFEPDSGFCVLYAVLQGYTMYGYAGRSYFVLGDDFYTGPSDVCPPISTLIYGMMNLAYGYHPCLQNPTPFAPANDGTNRCRQQAKKRPAVGAYYAGLFGDVAVPPVYFFSLSKPQVRAAQSIDCGSPIASVTYDRDAKPYCYAFFTYPKGSSAKAACQRKYPGSVVQVDHPVPPNSSKFGYWGVFGYFAYLPAPGSVKANYVFYGNTEPETAIVSYPVVQCQKLNPPQISQ